MLVLALDKQEDWSMEMQARYIKIYLQAFRGFLNIIYGKYLIRFTMQLRTDKVWSETLDK